VVETISTASDTTDTISTISTVEDNHDFCCRLCNTDFRTGPALQHHEGACDGTPQYKCAKCGESFFTAGLTRAHVQTCSVKPTFTCYTCQRTFVRQADLTKHAAKCKLQLETDSSEEEDDDVGPHEEMELEGGGVEKVDRFTYLGAQVTTCGTVHGEVLCRIAKATGTFRSLETCLWKRGDISVQVKLQVFRSSVLAVLLYGAETWNLLYDDISLLRSFYMRCLRTILRVNPFLHEYKLSHDRVLKEAHMPAIEEIINRARWRWLGHVLRMDDNRIPRKVLFSKRQGGRAQGAPAKRWSDLVRQDVRRWLPTSEDLLEVALDRSRWRALAGHSLYATPL